MSCGDTCALHNLYLDGELETANVVGFEEHLQDCPSCRGRYALDERLRLAIRRDASRYQAPIELRVAIRREADARERRTLGNLRFLGAGWNPVAIAAALAVAIVTSASLTASYVGSASAEDRVVEDVVASHVRSLMAYHLTDIASSDQEKVRPWFSGKVDALPPAVDLADAGFPLIGGRLDYVDQRNCAVLVYRHGDHVVNLLVWANEGEEPVPAESYARQGYNLVRFATNEQTFWAVSDLDREELDDFVRRFEVTTGLAAAES